MLNNLFLIIGIPEIIHKSYLFLINIFSILFEFNSFEEDYSSSSFKSVSIPFEGCKDDFLVYNNHLSSNCSSNVGMRSILNKGVECSFQALIDIENKIKNSKAEQDCKAILLDEKSSMNAKPEMKIFNNDVVF